MIEQKRFGGIMNLDDKEEFIMPNQHIYALNGRFYGGQNGLTFQNFPGNVEVSFSLPAGNNQCIGSFYDGLKQRIFWFNWNSNGRNGIYMYDLGTGVVTTLLLSFTNSTDDILNFDLDYPIPSTNIIYTTEEDGDILTWVARNDRPKELNIKEALDNKFGANWKAEYLDVAKAPPSIPIACAYEDDAANTVNNLTGPGGYKLYRFKYRFVYSTFQKSVWSSISDMPIPFNYTDQSVVTNPTKNCRIGLIFQTGPADVLKIEIAAQENLGIEFGNFFSVKILDKSQLSIPNNNTYIWNFYNDESYNYVDASESDLLFDYVPNKANTQELLNGNVLVYGGITEGYNPVVPDVEISVGSEAITYPNVNMGMLCSQNGTNGLSTDDIKISLVGKPNYATFVGSPTQISINIFNGSTTDNLVASTTSTADTIATLLNTLASQATGLGYTVVSNDGHSLVLRKTNAVLLNYTYLGNGDLFKPVNESVKSLELSSTYTYGLTYFDEKYKTNGVTTSADFNAKLFPVNFSGSFTPTLPLNFPIPYITLNIYHEPPDWARYYQVVRTNNLTKSNFLAWVSDRTFKDDQFAYISIESLNYYKVQNPTSVLSYDFINGDRIKFVCLFNNDKTINTNYDNTRDYEIVGQIVNPNINGLVQEGQFVKIKLPSTTISFDFGNYLSNAYYYYYIELYTPSKSVSNNLNVFYEFSEMFEIGDAHLPTRYHQGNTQNQNIGSGIPASVVMRNGDYYFRDREIRAGAFFKADLVPDVTYSWTNEPVVQLTIENIPVGTSYQVKNTGSGNTSNLNNWVVKTGANALNLNVKGSMFFKALNSTSNTLKIFLQIKTYTGTVTSLVELASITGAANDQNLEFKTDVNVAIPANRIAVPYLQETPVGSPPFSAKSISGVWTFVDTDHDFTIGVIDANFSDFFESKVNDNGRGLVVNPDEKELFYSTLLRWGLSYQQNTNINQINRFDPKNFDEVDRSKGAIQRFKTRDRILRLFQNRACGQYGVLAKYIQNNSGDGQLVTTNDILTKGNVNYYQGEYGLGDQYTGLVSGKNQDYFVDPVRGYEVRLSGDGLIPVSELFKGQFYIRNLLTPYNQTYIRIDGSKAKILGTYNFFDEEWVTVLQSGTRAGNTISNYCFSFNEKRNAYSSFFSFNDLDWITSAEDVMYMWKNGRLWVLNVGKPVGNYCNYFGTQYDCYITLVFNMNLLEVKSWQSVAEVASAIWDCPIVYTSVNSYVGQRQESSIGAFDFKSLEGEFKSAFFRDIHSVGGKYNGNFLKGNYLVATFRKEAASSVISLAEISVMTKDSPLNIK